MGSPGPALRWPGLHGVSLEGAQHPSQGSEAATPLAGLPPGREPGMKRRQEAGASG